METEVMILGSARPCFESIPWPVEMFQVPSPNFLPQNCWYHHFILFYFILFYFQPSFQVSTQRIHSKQSSYHPTHRCNNTLHTLGIILITSRNKHHPLQGNWDEEKVSMFSGPGFTSSVWFHGSVDILTPPFLQFHRKFQPPLEQGVSKTRIWVWKGWNARTGHCL